MQAESIVLDPRQMRCRELSRQRGWLTGSAIVLLSCGVFDVDDVGHGSFTTLHLSV